MVSAAQKHLQISEANTRKPEFTKPKYRRILVHIVGRDCGGDTFAENGSDAETFDLCFECFRKLTIVFFSTKLNGVSSNFCTENVYR